LVDASVLEKHTVSIFRAEVAMLGNGGIYIGLEEGKAVGVDQSGTRNEMEMVTAGPVGSLQAGVGGWGLGARWRIGTEEVSPLIIT
jgi:hypothetical protein